MNDLKQIGLIVALVLVPTVILSLIMEAIRRVFHLTEGQMYGLTLLVDHVRRLRGVSDRHAVLEGGGSVNAYWLTAAVYIYQCCFLPSPLLHRAWPTRV